MDVLYWLFSPYNMGLTMARVAFETRSWLEMYIFQPSMSVSFSNSWKMLQNDSVNSLDWKSSRKR